ncbi:kinase-like domain-containing protein [Panaeolus papilionaceus]|nr:kinase-like domain-containing protein [Panaeolus papilionaceus]
MDTLASSSQLPSPAESTDIFSLTDQVLSDRLEFIEEIGFGNWGSVWLCRPKPATTADGVVKPLGQKLAVKLVHRSKTSTTAARVRSLWNEMKIVRSFKSDPHPSIIPFHSFIITPSYALITMTYHPTLVPVEVEESKAREWFRYLLSGVEFLHQRGVVHNDIKPANILISYKNIPVLVDFGFAEKYDMDSDTAFHSNLSYGTPEYLSPERARGLPHDTRKSDVWSLGVTFFEILVGRTPFEHSDGEQFNSTDDLEKYWSRTLRGKWVGTWEFSKGIEKLLQRMIAPNADLRCTATQAMKDSYWQTTRADAQAAIHSKTSFNSSHNKVLICGIFRAGIKLYISCCIREGYRETTQYDTVKKGQGERANRLALASWACG